MKTIIIYGHGGNFLTTLFSLKSIDRLIHKPLCTEEKGLKQSYFPNTCEPNFM